MKIIIDIENLIQPNVANENNTIFTEESIINACSSLKNKPITLMQSNGTETAIGAVLNFKDGFIFGELVPEISNVKYREKNGFYIIDDFKYQSLSLRLRR